MRRRERNVDEHLSLFSSPSEEGMAQAEERAFRRFRSMPAAALKPPVANNPSRRPGMGWGLGLSGVAAALVVAVVVMQTRIDAHAVVEAADGGLYRVLGGQPLRAGERIEAGEAVRTNGSVGAILKLADGSAIEMRSKSELALERAGDGVRIRLGSGGIIVNAAKQRRGHLHVQTRDIAVSVVGTVFLVNTEEEGSRVAVIEGEVRVTQSGTETKLLTGEQVATNPKMELLPVKEEIAWSRQAGAHIALLEQSSSLLATIQNPRDARAAFEEISIRPTTTLPPEGRGGGGRPWVWSLGKAEGCSQGAAQIDPQRFAYYGVTAYTLIVHAYGNTTTLDGDGCIRVSNIAPFAGGPAWIRSDQWDIQATIPQGSSIDIESIRKRIQTLLFERFKVEIKPGTKEVPAYALTVTGDRLRFAGRGNGELWLNENKSASAYLPPGYKGVGNNSADGSPYLFFGKNASIADFLPVLVRIGGRPVLDQTGLTGQYSFGVAYPTFPDANGGTGGIAVPMNDATFASFRREFEKQLGFKLEDAKTTIDASVIASVEKPSEN